MKIVFAFNPDTRIYIGPVELGAGDLSPMEPGVYLIPGNCLEEAPPACPPGRRVVAVGNSWTLEEIPKPPAPPAPAPGPAPAPEPTLAERMAALSDAVQAHMDAVAKVYGYGDKTLAPMASAVSYAEEPSVPKFQDEGRALRAWRSILWASCYELLGKFQRGEALEPTKEGLLAYLPPFPGVTYRDQAEAGEAA